MKKSIRRALSVAAATSAIALSATTAQASNPESFHGGWSEDGGTFSSQQIEVASMATQTSSPKHTGKAEEKVINGTSHKRAHGWTTWVGVKHYTRARLETGKTVITDSGRKWGTGGTEAVTKYVAFNPNAAGSGFGKAKTYYGK